MDDIMKKFACSMATVFFVAAVHMTSSGAQANGKPTASAIWASPETSQATALNYAALIKGRWTAPERLQVASGMHVAPALVEDRGRNLWIVWIEQTERESILRYAVVRQGKMQTGRVSQSKEEQSYAPTILVDQNDVPWIAWSGVTADQLADVYVSRWNGNGWAEPTMVNEKNQTPDIVPFLGLREEQFLWISWLGMDGKEDLYVRYLAELRDGRWQKSKNWFPAEKVGEFVRQRTKAEQLPEQAARRIGGAFFAGIECEIQSVSDQIAAFMREGREQ